MYVCALSAPRGGWALPRQPYGVPMNRDRRGAEIKGSLLSAATDLRRFEWRGGYGERREAKDDQDPEDGALCRVPARGSFM